MKTKIYLCIAYFSVISFFLQTANAQANRALSNLAPTSVNQSLLPGTNNSINLGSTSLRWKTLHLENYLYLKGSLTMHRPGTTNFFAGGNAGNLSIAGNTNTGIGQNALYHLTSGGANTANGANSLYSNTTGYANTATGSGSLYYNSTGNGNTASGAASLYHNTSGYSNTASGTNSLYSNTTAFNNTANGYYSLYFNATGSYNTAIGSSALYFNTTGSYNTANGSQVLYSNITGARNTASGYFALFENTTGHYNTATGFATGSVSDNNLYCTFLGYDADQSVSTDLTNSTALGNTSRLTASNQVRIGNTSVTSIGGYEPWTTISDGRFKKNIKEDVPGLAFINQLHAITYTMDVTSLRNFLVEDRQNEAEDKMVRDKNPEAEASIQKGIAEKEKVIRTGFVAQEVEATAKKIGYEFSGVDKPQNEHTPYGLRYSEFVVPLVKAVQELSKINDKKDATINELKTRIEKLEAMMKVRQSNSYVYPAALGQNIPNPFDRTTTISYLLPGKYSSAKIIITDKNGKTLKELNVPGNGKGSIDVDAATFSPGIYQYSLIVDGKLMDTKQMEHLR